MGPVAGSRRWACGHRTLDVAPGKQPGLDTNVGYYDVGTLSNAQLGSNATITLNACNAGWGGRYSIAQLIANQLRRNVYAYEVGMFFGQDPNRRYPRRNEKPPNSKPMFMLPLGGAQAIEFRPQ